MSNLTKAQQKFIDRLLDSLEKDIIPWRATWDQSIVKPYNASNNIPYKGINLLNLYMVSIQHGYDDPRWMTFKQANDEGYRIKKGSVGTDIFFYSFRDMQTGELIEQSNLAKMTKEEREHVRLVTKSYVVFNANQIDGIPAIDVKKHSIEFKNDKAKEFISTLSKNANLNIHHAGNQPHYNPSTDKVVIPKVETFIDERAYYATLLHECGHATLHPSRLNRDAAARFGSEKYAKEELRAELTSAFLTMDMGFQLDSSHEENHQAYIQHWKEIIKTEPRFIFTAIKDAQKMREYLLEKGDYEKIYKIEKDSIKEKNKNMDNEKGYFKVPQEKYPYNLECYLDPRKAVILYKLGVPLILKNGYLDKDMKHYSEDKIEKITRRLSYEDEMKFFEEKELVDAGIHIKDVKMLALIEEDFRINAYISPEAMSIKEMKVFLRTYERLTDSSYEFFEEAKVNEIQQDMYDQRPITYDKMIALRDKYITDEVIQKASTTPTWESLSNKHESLIGFMREQIGLDTIQPIEVSKDNESIQDKINKAKDTLSNKQNDTKEVKTKEMER